MDNVHDITNGTSIAKGKGKGKGQSNKPSWDHMSTKCFINLCLEEVEAGNRPNTHFTRQGWENIVKKFNTITRKNYDTLQLKNHWDSMKKEWIAQKSLTSQKGETGLGWDHTRQTMTTSDEWWAEKGKINKKFMKFKGKGLEYEDEYERLFSAIAATGAHAWSPNSGVMPKFLSGRTTKAVDNVYHPTLEEMIPNDDFDVNAKIPVTVNLNASPSEPTQMHLRGKSKSSDVMHSSRSSQKRAKVTCFAHQIDRLVTAVENFATSTMVVERSLSSIENIMDMVLKLPGIEAGDPLHMMSTRLFLKRDMREMFLTLPTDEIKVAWIKQEQQLFYGSILTGSQL